MAPGHPGHRSPPPGRDSKVPAGPQLAVTPTAWAAFLGGVSEA
ncbi:DUF397 domain-containing protein [Streptomyces sp. NBC_00435]